MNLNDANLTKDWLNCLSMFNTSSDPLDLLTYSENIPYKKINRIKKRGKGNNNSSKTSHQKCFAIP